MGRQECSDPSPTGSPTASFRGHPITNNLKQSGESAVRGDESDFEFLDLLLPDPFPLLQSPTVCAVPILDLEHEDSIEDPSLLLISNSDAEAAAEARLNTHLQLNTPSLEFQQLVSRTASSSSNEPSVWTQSNIGINLEGCSSTMGVSQGQFPIYEVSGVPNCNSQHPSAFITSHKHWPVEPQPQQSISAAEYSVTRPIHHPALTSTEGQSKRLRRNILEYPDEYVIKGVTFPKELFAKAYIQHNIVKTTKCLFRALFKDEDLSSKSLSGRKPKNEKDRPEAERLDENMLDAISTLAWWIEKNKAAGKNPYDINPNEVSLLSPPSEEMRDVRKKAFVETRNEMGRKRRQSEVGTAYKSSLTPAKRRNSHQ